MEPPEIVRELLPLAHEVRQRARCYNIGLKGNNRYQIIDSGNSDLVMDGAGVRQKKSFMKTIIRSGETNNCCEHTQPYVIAL